MKKILLMILCLLLFPVIVNAQESCKVVSRTGSEIGDEVKCGTESFYVISHNQNQTFLLAKYNLMVGDKIDYIALDNALTMDSVNQAENYCMELAENAGYHPYYVYAMKEGNYYPTDITGCRIYEKIEYERVIQDERAVGTKLVNGKSVLPLYGITYMNPNWGYDAIHDNIYYQNEYDFRGDLILNNSSFKSYLDGYQSELERQGIPVSKVSFITLSKTLKLLEDISGEDVDVELEYPSDGTYHDYPYAFTGKMDITKYLDANYQWIYDITYWLGSGFVGDAAEYLDYYNDYYISNEGMLCAIGRGDCAYLPYPIGNGVRPLITIPNENIQYLIQTETDGNGTIEVVETASGNDSILFKVTAKKGYKLNKIVIKTDSGERVEFSEGTMINNADGTVSIDRNVFTMPFSNVVIEARWAIDNPKTGSIIIINLIMLIVLGTITIILNKKSLANS